MRDFSSHRVIKNQIRVHLKNHLPDCLVNKAKHIASEESKHLIYHLPNGQFKLFKGTASSVKTEITNMPKDGIPSLGL